MIEVQNLSKDFEDPGNRSHAVLNDLSLKAADGEFVCILGPSGSGKSVFLYLLAGFLHPTKGRVLFNLEEVKGPGTDRIMLFQEHALFPWKTVLENVLFGLETIDQSKEEKIAIANRYIEMVGLAQYKHWHIHTLSGGMRQRVAFARALVADPKVLLMDEPFAALDSQYRKFMRRSLEKIWQSDKKTIFFVTHSVNEAIALADTIYLFSSQPAEIRQKYVIDLPRPRDPQSPEFIRIGKEIEAELIKEFEKTLEQKYERDSAMDEILAAL